MLLPYVGCLYEVLKTVVYKKTLVQRPYIPNGWPPGRLPFLRMSQERNFLDILERRPLQGRQNQIQVPLWQRRPGRWNNPRDLLDEGMNKGNRKQWMLKKYSQGGNLSFQGSFGGQPLFEKRPKCGQPRTCRNGNPAKKLNYVLQIGGLATIKEPPIGRFFLLFT